MSLKHAADIIHRTDHCAYCPTLCMHACPVSTAEGSDVVTPWGKMSLARWLANGSARLTEEAVEVLYKCTGCGACRDACKHAVDVAATLQMARADAIEEGIRPYARDRFEAPVETDDMETLPAGVTGYRLFAAGFMPRFLQVARAASRRWKRREEVVFESAADARCARELYPAFDVEITARVVLASERSDTRKPEFQSPVAYFEACHIARGEGMNPDIVLANAEKFARSELIQLRWRGTTATCCGGGSAYAVTSPDGARAAGRRIAENAVVRGAKTLVVGCGGCAKHLGECADGLPLDVVALGLC